MELMKNEDGSRTECYKVEVYFESALKRNAFYCWLQGQGDVFEAWFKGKESLRGTECEMCRWCDPTQSQCYDGHLQGIGPCEGYEEEP